SNCSRARCWSALWTCTDDAAKRGDTWSVDPALAPAFTDVPSCSRSVRSAATGDFEMSDTANTVSSETGLPMDMVHKGLGAILDFLRQQLGAETFDQIRAAVPNATDFLNRFESSPEAAGGGGLLGALTGLASKFLGGGAGDLSKLLENFAKLGFKPEQIEA